jgi:putative addiction module killer protein
VVCYCTEEILVGRVTREKEILIYAHGNGTEPYSDWLENLKDVVGRAHIQARITRLKYGNYGDCEPVGEGVRELRIHFGPGYRVYFAEKRSTVVILLCGGDKGNQKRCIKDAKLYWKEYQKK